MLLKPELPIYLTDMVEAEVMYRDDLTDSPRLRDFVLAQKSKGRIKIFQTDWGDFLGYLHALPLKTPIPSVAESAIYGVLSELYEWTDKPLVVLLEDGFFTRNGATGEPDKVFYLPLSEFEGACHA